MLSYILVTLRFEHYVYLKFLFRVLRSWYKPRHHNNRKASHSGVRAQGHINQISNHVLPIFGLNSPINQLLTYQLGPSSATPILTPLENIDNN